MASVTLVDANILLYAYEVGGPEQERASRWLEGLLDSDEIVALPWGDTVGVPSGRTNLRAFDPPLTMAEAFSVLRGWVEEPGVVILHPGPAHARILERLAAEYRVTSGLVTDAFLAALAIGHGAVLASADRDFARITELRWVNPPAE